MRITASFMVCLLFSIVPASADPAGGGWTVGHAYDHDLYTSPTKYLSGAPVSYHLECTTAVGPRGGHGWTLTLRVPSNPSHIKLLASIGGQPPVKVTFISANSGGLWLANGNACPGSPPVYSITVICTDMDWSTYKCPSETALPSGGSQQMTDRSRPNQASQAYDQRMAQIQKEHDKKVAAAHSKAEAMRRTGAAVSNALQQYAEIESARQEKKAADEQYAREKRQAEEDYRQAQKELRGARQNSRSSDNGQGNDSGSGYSGPSTPSLGVSGSDASNDVATLTAMLTGTTQAADATGTSHSLEASFEIKDGCILVSRRHVLGWKTTTSSATKLSSYTENSFSLAGPSGVLPVPHLVLKASDNSAVLTEFRNTENEKVFSMRLSVFEIPLLSQSSYDDVKARLIKLMPTCH